MIVKIFWTCNFSRGSDSYVGNDDIGYDNDHDNDNCNDDNSDNDLEVNLIFKMFNFLLDKSYKNFMIKWNFNLNLKYFNLNFHFNLSNEKFSRKVILIWNPGNVFNKSRFIT